MSKFVSTALRVASIGVAVLFPLTRLGSFVIAGLNIGASLTAPKAKQQARQASVTTLQLGEVPRQAILGKCACRGQLTPVP